MTAREKRMLDRIKSTVEDMMRAKEEGAYISSPVNELIEDAYTDLNLDGTFNFTETIILKANKYKINTETGEATKMFKGVPVRIYKNGYDFYSIKFGKGRSRHLFTDFGDLNDCGGKNFITLYEDYIND
jgi:hypothetical protein